MSGTITITERYVRKYDEQRTRVAATGGVAESGIGGTLTEGYIPVASGSRSLEDSLIREDGSIIWITGSLRVTEGIIAYADDPTAVSIWAALPEEVRTRIVLNDISNVSAATPAVDDVLSWNGTNWVPAAIGAGGGGAETDPIFTAHVAYGITSTNITNWGTAYTERHQWNGGTTNLVAATGRASLGVLQAGTASGQARTNLENDGRFGRLASANTWTNRQTLTGGYQEHIRLDRHSGAHLWDITQSVGAGAEVGQSIRFVYNDSIKFIIYDTGAKVNGLLEATGNIIAYAT
jgi:hypothetical protein